MMIRFLLFSLVLLSSCSSVDTDGIEIMKGIYSEASDSVSVKEEEGVDVELQTSSFSASGITVADFSVWFSETFGKGIIFSAQFKDSLLTAEITDANYLEVANAISRHLDTELVNFGNTVFIGKQKLDDMAVYVRKVKGIKVDDLTQIITSLSGAEASGLKGHVTSDGIVFMFASQQSLLPFARAFDQLEAIKTDAWVVQLFMVDFNRTALTEAGLDLSVSGDVAYKLLLQGQGVNNFLPTTKLSSSIDANQLLTGLFKLSNTSSLVRISARPLFVMADGSTVNYENKESIPFVRRVTTEQGFVQDAELQYIDAGLLLNLGIRDLSQGSLLTMKLENSKIVSIDDNGLPRLSSVSVSSEVPLLSSGVYLIAQSELVESSDNAALLGGSRSSSTRTLQVFARVFRLTPKFKGLKNGRVDVEFFRSGVEERIPTASETFETTPINEFEDDRK